MFYVRSLHFEEGNLCFDFVKSYRFVHEEQYAQQDNWNEGAMYQKLCHIAMKHDKPLEGNGKAETQDMNSPLGKKTDFDFEVSFVEETTPSHRNVWNHWIGNGNPGMDAVTHANGIDTSQLSKDHRMQQKKRT